MGGESPTLNEFRKWLICHSEPLPHSNFVEARTSLDEAIRSYGLVFLTGPTGVGKTALAAATAACLNRPVDDVPTELRAAMATARTPRSRPFSFKDLWIDVLDSLHDPLPGRKLGRPASGSDPEFRRRRLPGRVTEHELFDMVRAAARDRKLRALFIDECVPLLHSRTPHVLVQTLDILRDLNDKLDFAIVLIATPRIFENLSLSCELSRRRRIVYFRSYGHTDFKQVEAYARAVHTLFSKLPEALRPELDGARHEQLLKGTTGCVGELFCWVRRALERALQFKDEALRWEHLEKTVTPDATLGDMLHFARKGEMRHAELMRRTFGADLPWEDAPSQAAVACPPTPAKASRNSSTDKRRRGSRICQPAPKRHKVA